MSERPLFPQYTLSSPLVLFSWSRHAGPSGMENPAVPYRMRSARTGESQWTTMRDPHKLAHWLEFPKFIPSPPFHTNGWWCRSQWPMGTKLPLSLCFLSNRQVAEVTTKLEHMRPYWVSLPRLVCSDRVATGIGAEDKCWNGMSRAR